MTPKYLVRDKNWRASPSNCEMLASHQEEKKPHRKVSSKTVSPPKGPVGIFEKKKLYEALRFAAVRRRTACHEQEKNYIARKVVPVGAVVLSRRMRLFSLSCLLTVVFAHPFEVSDVLQEAMVNVTMEDLYGTWYHPVVKMYLNVSEANVVTGTELQPHTLGACTDPVHCPNSVLGVVRVGPYYWILHQNGVIKSAPASDNQFWRAALAATESTGPLDLVKNLNHVARYGCFCLLVVTDSRTIKRYNRWKDPHGYYHYTLQKVHL